MKKARMGFKELYDCTQPWPEDCFVQAGENGMVFNRGSINEVFDPKNKNPLKTLKKNYSYSTAFFEAFPSDPKTFIRGEGKTVKKAEDKAWKEFEKIRDCDGHEFERKGYTNGGGICTKCGMFSAHEFEPIEEEK
jgi:hypothetical protein